MRVKSWFVRAGTAVSVTFAALLASCTDATGPGTSLLDVQGMSLSELGQQVDVPSARVEVVLREDGVVAGRLAVKTGDEVSGEERVSGAVVNLSVEGDQGTLTLSWGAVITFDPTTSFAGLRGDAVGFEQFVAHVTEALSLGREPRVKAVREAPDVPQDPTDPTFHALALRVTDDPIPAAFSLNVDRDNLTIVDPPPPDAILTVLGIGIEIRVSEGLTELFRDRDERREIAFEGPVLGVRPDAGEFTIQQGDREVRIRVVADSKLGLNGQVITSLGPIAELLAAGKRVRAVGEGVIRTDQDVVLGLVVRFRTEDGLEPAEFGGRVREVSVDQGLIFLLEGPTVKVGPDTRMAVNGEPIESLARIAEALAAGKAVFAFGEGVREVGSDRILAAFVRFEIDTPPTVVEFAGRVREVGVAAGVFAIAEGPLVQVTDATDYTDDTAFTSLAAVANALEQGLAVYVEGRGTVVPGTDRRTIAATLLRFRVAQ